MQQIRCCFLFGFYSPSRLFHSFEPSQLFVSHVTRALLKLSGEMTSDLEGLRLEALTTWPWGPHKSDLLVFLIWCSQIPIGTFFHVRLGIRNIITT